MAASEFAFREPLKGVLPESFFGRDTVRVSRDLLGKVLIVRSDPDYALDDPRAKVTAGRIVETEAYREDDPASHSHGGETPRSAVMFREPGRAYVYFIYGMYEMLNFVTEPKGIAGAVLVRAIEPLYGEDLMRRRRTPASARELTGGPGKLCRAMGIRLSHNDQSLSGPSLFVVDDGFVPKSVSVSPRVGIRKGTETMWRFFITGNACVSRAPQNKLAKVLRPDRRGERSL